MSASRPTPTNQPATDAENFSTLERLKRDVDCQLSPILTILRDPKTTSRRICNCNADCLTQAFEKLVPLTVESLNKHVQVLCEFGELAIHLNSALLALNSLDVELKNVLTSKTTENNSTTLLNITTNASNEQKSALGSELSKVRHSLSSAKAAGGKIMPLFRNLFALNENQRDIIFGTLLPN